MKYPVSGQATGVPDATQAINLMGMAITTNRTLFLQKVWFFKDIVGEARVGLFDVTMATGAPSTTALKWMSGMEYDQDIILTEEFPGNGLEFKYGCCVGLQTSSTSTGLTICAGVGYER